jgi:hypothetical protein
VCTCNDWELNGACCHLLAAFRHPELQGQHLAPISSLLASQLVTASSASYEQPTCEPLGDNIADEMQCIQRAGEAAMLRLSQQRTNADPLTAEVRCLCNGVQRFLLGMPAGAERDACMETLRRAAGQIKEQAAAAGFKPTAARAGKQLNKQLRRPENRRLEVPLFPRRAKARSAPASHPQLGLSNASFPVLKKKGKESTKVSPCVQQCICNSLVAHTLLAKGCGKWLALGSDQMSCYCHCRREESQCLAIFKVLSSGLGVTSAARQREGRKRGRRQGIQPAWQHSTAQQRLSSSRVPSMFFSL